jgi:hypothetical protein
MWASRWRGAASSPRSFPAANEVRNNEASAKEHDGAVEEDLQALVIAQMEARHGDVPAESNGTAQRIENKDTGDIFRSCGACIRVDRSKDSSASSDGEVEEDADRAQEMTP